MRFSTRATYGLKALLYLANHYSERAVSVSQIAKEEGISAQYLEQILHRLKKRQWIKSLRGPAGGYVLAQKPSEIKVGPVLRDLEGRKSDGQARPKAAKPAQTGNIPSLAAGLFWERLLQQHAQYLDNMSLKELIDDARRVEKSRSSSPSFSFNI